MAWSDSNRTRGNGFQPKGETWVRCEGEGFHPGPWALHPWRCRGHGWALGSRSWKGLVVLPVCDAASAKCCFLFLPFT